MPVPIRWPLRLMNRQTLWLAVRLGLMLSVFVFGLVTDPHPPYADPANIEWTGKRLLVFAEGACLVAAGSATFVFVVLVLPLVLIGRRWAPPSWTEAPMAVGRGPLPIFHIIGYLIVAVAVGMLVRELLTHDVRLNVWALTVMEFGMGIGVLVAIAALTLILRLRFPAR